MQTVEGPRAEAVSDAIVGGSHTFESFHNAVTHPSTCAKGVRLISSSTRYFMSALHTFWSTQARVCASGTAAPVCALLLACRWC